MALTFAQYGLQCKSFDSGEKHRLIARMDTYRLNRELAALGHSCTLNSYRDSLGPRIWIEANDNTPLDVQEKATNLVREAAARVRITLT